MISILLFFFQTFSLFHITNSITMTSALYLGE